MSDNHVHGIRLICDVDSLEIDFNPVNTFLSVTEKMSFSKVFRIGGGRRATWDGNKDFHAKRCMQKIFAMHFESNNFVECCILKINLAMNWPIIYLFFSLYKSQIPCDNNILFY